MKKTLTILLLAGTAGLLTAQTPQPVSMAYSNLKQDIALTFGYIDQVKNLKINLLKSEEEKNAVRYKYSEISTKYAEAKRYNSTLKARIRRLEESVSQQAVEKAQMEEDLKRLKYEYQNLQGDLRQMELRVAELEKNEEEFQKIISNLLEKYRQDRRASIKHSKMLFDRIDPTAGTEPVHFPKKLYFDLFYFPLPGELFDDQEMPDQITADVKLKRIDKKDQGKTYTTIIGSWEIPLQIKYSGNSYYYESDKNSLHNADDNIRRPDAERKYYYELRFNDELIKSREFTIKN